MTRKGNYERAMTGIFRALCLGLLLVLGCSSMGEATLPGESHDPPRGPWLANKRFRPSKPKPPEQSPKGPVADTPPTETHETPRPGQERRPAPARMPPSYKLGESDGGPGQWEKAPPRPKGAGYQQEVTGAPEGVEYAVPGRTPSGKVLFDGYKDGKLLDAKDWTEWPPMNKDFWQKRVLDDAVKQLEAAKGTPIEWHFPNGDKAKAVLELLKERNIEGIDVKVTRKK